MASIAETGRTAASQKDWESQELTPEYLSVFIPDYKNVVHERLYAIGVLAQGQTLDFNFPPIKHENSDGEYLFEGIIGDDWVFIYFMRANKKTSPHKHSHKQIEVREDYHLLRGKIFLHLGEDGSSVIELTEDNSFVTVLPDTIHRGSTDAHFAFVLVRMRGAAPIPRDQLHIAV